MPARTFPRAGVASPHYLASASGLATLARGGNAMDAVLAANLTLGVVAPYFCGYGGDVFAIVWDGRLTGYLGSGRSASAASLEALRAQGADVMPVLGAHAVAVPGAVAGWFALLERWGTRSFGDLAADALLYARDGFEVTPRAAELFEGCALLYEGFSDWQAVYGEVYAGSTLRQPALARTIERLASDGPDDYYRGPIAGALAEAVQRGGGALTTHDLAAHHGRWCDPMQTGYRDVEVAELPPPTQGITALEAFRLVDGLDLPEEPAARQHALIEAMKMALADREDYVTDPDVMSVPAEALLADDWIATRRAAIDLGHARSPEPRLVRRGGTAYLCASDADGLLVSLIQSNFLAFGSGIHVPEWGINLNNRAASFSLHPTDANALAPSKLPMHTLIPAMALRNGRPWLAFGTMGADAQPQVQLQVLVHVVDEGADIQDALDAPRWRVDVSDWRVRAERGFSDEVLDGLRSRGHLVETTSRRDTSLGHAHAIEVRGGGYAAATDPRAEGDALGL